MIFKLKMKDILWCIFFHRKKHQQVGITIDAEVYELLVCEECKTTTGQKVK